MARVIQPTLFGTHPGHRLDRTTALADLTAADPVLGRVVARVGPFPLEPPALSPFAYLLAAITRQQLSGKAAATIHGRVLALYPRDRVTPERLADTPVETLRAAGLSGAKTRAVHDLAARALDGTVPTRARLHQLPDEEVIERLTAVRGVGRWTVEMLLMFYLGRPDVLPVDDLGIRKGFGVAFGMPHKRDAFGLPHPDAIRKRAERWRPWRSVACWYLWRALE